MKKFSAEMKVVRFGAEDMIVTSAPLTMTWSYFGDGVGKNGTVEYDGQSYIMSNSTNYNSLISALNPLGINDSTSVKAGGSDQLLSGILHKEYSNTTPTGVGSDVWNGTFKYDSALNKFIKQ